MKVRRNRALVVAMAVLMSLASAACGKKEPPPPPPPAATDDADRLRREAEAREAAERARLDAEARAAEEARAALARTRATLEEMVFFDYDKSEIRAEARTILDAKVRILRDDPSITIRIVGHADERGSTEYNLALGMRRANAIQDYMAGYGIASDRMGIQSMGEERPLDRGSNETSWARNRRGEFVILTGLTGR